MIDKDTLSESKTLIQKKYITNITSQKQTGGQRPTPIIATSICIGDHDLLIEKDRHNNSRERKQKCEQCGILEDQPHFKTYAQNNTDRGMEN